MSAQTALWSVPEYLGWWWYGTLSLISAVTVLIMLFKLILGWQFGALMFARCLICGGLVCFTYRSGNSGFSEFGIALTVLGSFLSSLLLAFDWCARTHPLNDLIRIVVSLKARLSRKDSHVQH